MEGVQEHIIEWLKGEKTALVTAPSNSALKTRFLALAEKYPEDVKTLKINADGSLCGEIPVKFIRLKAPRELSEAQRQVLERMRAKKNEQ